MATVRRLEWMMVGAAAATGCLLALSSQKFAARHFDARKGEPTRASSRSRPTDIPAKGWKEIIRRVASAFNENRVLADAAGVTFYSILALFPAMAALVSVYGLFSSPSAVEKQVQMLSGLIPEGGMQIISGQLHTLASGGNSALSVGLIVSLATALWSANSGVKSLFDSLNVVYRVSERRSFMKLNLTSLIFTLGGLIFVLLAMGVVVVLPTVLNFVGLSGGLDILVKVVRWPVILIVIAVFLAIIYRYGPDRPPPPWKWVTWGSGFAAVGWAILSVLFSWYVANFGTYNQTYGSLGAAIGFMTWIWLSTTLVLVGGEINVETEAEAKHGPKRTDNKKPSIVGDLEQKLRDLQ